MSKGLFITGTGTTVGKTVIARAVARAFTRRGLAVAAAKPVESGAAFVNGGLVPRDAEALRAASRFEGGLERLNLYRFEDAVSPHLAASRVGAVIEADLIVELVRALEPGADVVLVEGAGGLLVPLSDEVLYADVARAIGYPVAIVADNVLGAINHTLLTVEAARRRGLTVAGVILNRTPPEALDNEGAIARHGDVRVLGLFPDASVGDDDALAEIAEQTLDLDALFG
ncbi:MAG: dethiobiotin synthase [Deltaproteobacteria bacterium]|nr:dethiobiotin synthase [Deltaproteobacteria bacterium]